VNKLNQTSILNYSFNDPALLQQALTHSSTMQRDPDGAAFNNERLEFLGDAILNALIAEELYQRQETMEEGRLSRLRAQIVCEEALAKAADRLELSRLIALGRSEERNRGRERPGLAADALEAVIGAIYLDGGLTAARNFVVELLAERINRALRGELRSDYKTELQERLQLGGIVQINYLLDRSVGPDHNKTFYISLWADGEKIGEGSGHSKKEAEQAAAEAALKELAAGGNDLVF
jgi:ribonuclease-3